MVLEGKFRAFYDEANAILQNCEIITNELLLHALSINASCYDYTPQIIIKVRDEKAVIALFDLANKHDVALTFRTAGTSLSGQCSTDSVLVMLGGAFDEIILNDDASVIECGCGVIGAKANEALAKFGKKIGPDPATIATAMIGGIFNNNSSGMCCGVAGNSYNTIHSVRAILLDGTIIDTSDEESIRHFHQTHADMISRILDLKRQISADYELTNLIKSKFAIKNTTGYSINALVDFSEIKDILNHILIGSEGTLAFISKVRYFSVYDAPLKVCGLLFFKELREASSAVVALAGLNSIVSSAEMMDGSCLKALKSMKGMPEILYECDDSWICLLFQSESHDRADLENNLNAIKAELAHLMMAREPLYSYDESEQNQWWKLRKSILPIVAGHRKPGSTVITEDVCFKINDFIRGANMIKELLSKHGFDDGVIFGHALSGNLHFNITPDLNNASECKNFENLMSELCAKVALMQGSMKAEHGTGRMVAPFIELEWGQRASKINKEIKNIFDERGILNPDVIITKNSNIYKERLKLSPNTLSAIPQYSDMINKCMECGFCEKVCPSAKITLSPRGRISALRWIQNLARSGQHKKAFKMLKEYEYYGIETCARCSSCKIACPLEIDTAKIAKELLQKPNALKSFTLSLAQRNFGILTNIARFGLSAHGWLSDTFGAKNISNLSARLKDIFGFLPFMPVATPRANYYKFENSSYASEHKIIYFSACSNRVMKTRIPLQKSIESLCEKAKIGVIYPSDLNSLCCGKIFEGDEELFAKNLGELNAKLLELSNHGEISIVVDHSSCFYTMLKNLDERLRILDISEFLLEIAPRLEITKSNKKILVHQLCLLKKIGKAHNIVSLAKMLSDDVEVIKSFECCGFAGNKGFSTPELNQSSTKNLHIEARERDIGVSSSSTCQIGLSSYSGIEFENIAYYFDLQSKAR